ncbi:MAG: TonB-dependent receptor domain-containing protein [Flavobacteriales bacterium]
MKQLIIIIALLFSFQNYATNPNDKNGSISGIVIDKNLQEPIPYVTVAIKSLSGEIITGGITNEKGVFFIKDIPEGKYKVSIQFIGYITYESEIEITSKNNKINLGSIQLEEDVSQLEEVVVVAEKTTIQQKLDRKVVTIGKDLQTAGSTASEIMNNIPSVNVDQQTGNISLRGNENVRVMVDGKLSNVPIAQLLKQIPSTSIKQIELITNPSAKYNPEGMSGIINIVLHKNTKLGFNGNVSVGLTYEEQAKFNASIDLNYRNGKFNFYANYGNNTSKNENYGNVFRVQQNIQQNFNFLDDRQSNLFKAGVDFYLNDHHTLSFFTNQNIFDGNTQGRTQINYLEDTNFNQTQDFLQLSENTSSQYNFDYKIDFKKEGHNIELETDYNLFDSNENGIFSYLETSDQANYQDFVTTDRERLTINLDYVNPLSETTKLELGLQTRLFNTLIDYHSTGLSFNENGEQIPTPNTNFDYTRNIYSAYATFSKKYKKWTYQLGLRAETVNVDATALETDQTTFETNTYEFTNDYIELYPSAFFTYNPSEKNQYQLSYSRRIDRPGIDQVNPIREWSTPLISSLGNSNLQPQFTNSVEINYTRSLKKGSITAGIFYRAIEDEINRTVFIDRTDLSKLIISHDNFDNTNAYGIEISSNLRPTKWWSLNASFDMYQQTQKGFSESIDPNLNNPTVNDIQTINTEVDNLAYNFRMFNNFKATKNLSFSAFGFYRGANKSLQFEVEPMYFVNIGARYNLWEGRGTFSINYNDIFDTMKFAFEGQQPYKQDGEFNWESNTVYVGLSYRFGGGKYKAKSRKRRENDEKSGGGGVF